MLKEAGDLESLEIRSDVQAPKEVLVKDLQLAITCHPKGKSN